MRRRLGVIGALSWSLLAAALLGPAIGSAQAAGHPSPPPASPSGSAPATSVQAPVAPGSAGPLLAQAQRVYQTMRATQYSHRNAINPATGVYYWDSVGFTDWALKQATPKAYQAFHTQMKVPADEPGPASAWASFLTGTPGPAWQLIPVVTSLTGGELMVVPGEIVLEGQAQPGSTRGKVAYPGHTAVIAGPPRRLSGGSYAVFVYDSTVIPGHGNYDSRYTDPRALPLPGTTARYSGAGYGTMRLTVDASGAPTGAYWSAGARTPIGLQGKPVVPVLARPLS